MPDAQEELDRLTVSLGDAVRGVDADGYVDFLQNVIATLKELDKEASEFGSETLVWEIVDAGHNSPVFATICGRPKLKGQEQASQGTVGKFLSGVDQLNRSNRLPAGFSEPALKHLVRLGSYARRLSPVISSSNTKIRVSDDLATHADWAIKTIRVESRYFKEYGSLRGTLKSVSTSGEKRDKVILVDRLTGEETPCYFRDDSVESEVRKGWKHRVVVTGEIHVDRKTRKPHKVIIHELRTIPSGDQLPQLEDLEGIDITGGVEAAEYVRRMRDDD